MLWGLGGEADTNLSESLVVLVLVPWENDSMIWEVLSLEDSSEKLLAAKTVKRVEFEEALRAKLQPIQRGDTP